jgi:hypothetical protein
MAQTQSMAAASIKIYINGVVFPNCQSLQYSLDFGEEEIFGIDSIYPQEICSNKVTCSGTISGVRIKSSGGLQAKRLTSLLGENLENNYFSVRVEDISTSLNILFIPYAKVVREDTQIQAKGLVKFSFSFKGILAQQELDIIG